MKSKIEYDYLIIGAGPAGMFAAYELAKITKNKKICLVEMGNSIDKRKKNDVMFGFGGAGTYSDGKLHYTPILSHRKALHLISIHEYKNIINYVDKIYTDYGVDGEYYPKETEKVDELVKEAQTNDIKLFVRKIRHVGTDKLKEVMKKFQKYFEQNSVDLIFNTKITDLIIEDKICKGVIDIKGKKIKAKKVLLAPGRVGSLWLQELCKNYNIPYIYDTVEIGVRVEFHNTIMKKFTDVLYESIFEIRTKSFDDIIRTFCPCPNGRVAIEQYQGYVCVNGHSNSLYDSDNSNFAFVSEVDLTEPIENTTLYAQKIAELSTTLGGGKPLLQRLADLKAGRRSTWTRINKSFVEPTLKDVTPGDISMAMPHRIITNIIEGLEALNSVMPGIDSGSTLLYAPEVKYRGSKIKTTNDLETNIKNLFVAGDGAGVSGNIIGAAATGIMAARGMK